MNEILRRVENCLFPIIVEKSTDTSTVEQLKFSIRYHDSKISDIRENILAFMETISYTGEAIAVILHYLVTCNLLFDNFVGQSFDGAFDMAGIYRGCQEL